ncbi:MAG: 6-pyruvoyl tetrahydropterin synthase family protein [Flavobacteriales bacterium]
MIDQLLRVTKEFTFEAAHALDGYDGKCKDIHGHSYKLSVTVLGKVNLNKEDPKCGMVIDFGEIKKIVKGSVLDQFDHYLLLRSDSRFKGIESHGERIRYVNYQPTCENMLLEIVSDIQHDFPDGVTLIEATLRETATGYAQWKLSDNA